jgi:UDP-N-acetylglucosamine 3-dehydrogenase
MASQHNIGIIGFGWAGQQHARALAQMPDRAQVVAVAETNESVRQRVAQTNHDWKVTADYRELLALPHLDAVSICLPHNLHAPVAIEAARAGRHVLVEKPLASTLTEADAMIEAAQAAGVVLMVAENVRFHATYQAVASRLQQGILGELFLLRIAREHNEWSYLRERPWFLTDQDAGIMLSGGVHDLELMRMLGGEAEHIYAVQGPKSIPEMQADDNAVAVAGLRGGIVGVIVETFGLHTPRAGVFGSVHGRQGSLWFDEDTLRLYRHEVDDQKDALETIPIEQHDTFVAEMAHFLDCLDNRQQEPVTSGRRARAGLAAVMAAYESMRTGQRIQLSDYSAG